MMPQRRRPHIQPSREHPVHRHNARLRALPLSLDGQQQGVNSRGLKTHYESADEGGGRSRKRSGEGLAEKTSWGSARGKLIPRLLLHTKLEQHWTEVSRTFKHGPSYLRTVFFVKFLTADKIQEPLFYGSTSREGT